MTTEAKFPEVVEAVRQAALGRLPEEQPVEFAHGFISEVQALLGLDFSAPGMFARPDRDKFCGQVQRALNKLAETRVLVKSGEGRGNVRYWSPAAYRAHLEQENAERAARAAIDARKADLMRRARLLVADATFWVTDPSRVEMNLDTLADLLDLAERAGS